MYPAERLGDLRAQIAANELGARRLVELAERIGVANLRTSIEELLDYGERRGRAAVWELPRGARAAPELMGGASPGEAHRIQIPAEGTIGGSRLPAGLDGNDRR